MLEVNKTHEEFSNVAEDDKKKTENPENPEKKRRTEDFGATSPGGIFSYESFEKLWNQMRLDMFLRWSWVHTFFVGCFWLFIFLQSYKIFRQIEFEVRGKGYLFRREYPLWFSKLTSPFCNTPSIEIVEYAKGSSEKLKEATNRIADLEHQLKVKAPGDPAGPADGPGAPAGGAGAPAGGAGFGALKKKRISLKR